MTTEQFILSNKRNHRIIRHLVFWAIYSLYFFVQSIWYPQEVDHFLDGKVYKDAIINFSCFIPVCVISVYTSIYFLLPAFLQRNRYKAFVLSFIALYIGGIGINYFCSLLYYSLTPHSSDMDYSFMSALNLGYVNSMAAILVSVIALGIKAAKNLYIQQKENLLIAQKKTRLELQLHSARIHPDFLFRTLNSIHAKILSGGDSSTEMVLRLSDLLSYTLYNGTEKLVPLEQELSALQDFVYLEQREQDKFCDIDLHVDGEKQGKYLAPMVLLSLLDDSVNFLNDHCQFPMITTRIKIRRRWLLLTLALHFEERSDRLIDWRNIAERCRTRLRAIYASGCYHLETKEGEGEMWIELRLHLKSSSIKPRPRVHAKKNSYEAA